MGGIFNPFGNVLDSLVIKASESVLAGFWLDRSDTENLDVVRYVL